MLLRPPRQLGERRDERPPAGQLPGADGISGPDVVAEIKGRHMLIDRYAELFGEVVPEGM